MFWITDIIALGSLTEAGDNAALQAAGITHVILCQSGMVWPHASPDAISVVALDLTGDAKHRKGVLKALFQGLKSEHEAGYKYLLADTHGGAVEAAYLGALVKAHLENKKFNTVMNALETAHPDMLKPGGAATVTKALKDQGKVLLP